VVADLSSKDEILPANLFAFGYNYSTQLDKWNLTDLACDFLFIGDKQLGFNIPGTLGVIQNADSWNSTKDRHYPLFDAATYTNASSRSDVLNFVQVGIEILTDDFISILKKDKTIVLVLKSDNENALAELRRAVVLLIDAALKIPVIIKREYELDENGVQLHAATDLGGLLVDGLGDGCWITGANVPNKVLNSTSFGILQASRARTSKTEYISCPSCGRTLFDLQETTAKIRNRTDHLKGVKIGIMGCIVNGPGEMADADYGYVGTGKGKITLYKGQEVVRRNIASEGALEALEELIKEHGDWVERPNVEA
jgi:(E)-4-hydroxy-3-methylbut-2-enyl-diphosphate synthase